MCRRRLYFWSPRVCWWLLASTLGIPSTALWTRTSRRTWWTPTAGSTPPSPSPTACPPISGRRFPTRAWRQAPTRRRNTTSIISGFASLSSSKPDCFTLQGQNVQFLQYCNVMYILQVSSYLSIHFLAGKHKMHVFLCKAKIEIDTKKKLFPH